MTLLPALALVFSLFAVTPALAGAGPGPGDGDQPGDTVRSQDRDQVRAQDETCRADLQESDCDPAREQTREQTQTRTSTPEQDQPLTREQVQNQNREQVGECSDDAPGTDCDETREALRQQARRQLWEQIAAMFGSNAESAVYRHVFRSMWMYMFGSFPV
jgi:hypothetical protein